LAPAPPIRFAIVRPEPALRPVVPPVVAPLFAAVDVARIKEPVVRPGHWPNLWKLAEILQKTLICKVQFLISLLTDVSHLTVNAIPSKEACACCQHG
jgi:hypothetical protein